MNTKIGDLKISDNPIGAAIQGGFIAALGTELIDKFLPKNSSKYVNTAAKLAVAAVAAKYCPYWLATPRIIQRLKLSKQYWAVVKWLNRYRLTRWIVKRQISRMENWQSLSKIMATLMVFDAMQNLGILPGIIKSWGNRLEGV